MPIHQSYVITSRGCSSYAFEHLPHTSVQIAWDLDDATVLDISFRDGRPPQHVSLADVRAWLKQREVDAWMACGLVPSVEMSREEFARQYPKTDVANPDAPVSQWERK